MNEKYLILLDRVETIDVDQKKIEKKAFYDYLLDKQVKGLCHDNIISFEDDYDYAYFERLLSNLDLTITDILTDFTKLG